jgi:hypothetical protein
MDLASWRFATGGRRAQRALGVCAPPPQPRAWPLRRYKFARDAPHGGLGLIASLPATQSEGRINHLKRPQPRQNQCPDRMKTRHHNRPGNLNRPAPPIAIIPATVLTSS